MHARDLVSDPILNRIYLGMTEIHHRDISRDWFVGFLVHLQRTNSRAVKSYLRGVLAQHTKWMTEAFDIDDPSLDEVLATKHTELDTQGYTYLQLPQAQVDELIAAFHGTEVCNIDQSEKYVFGPRPTISRQTALSSEFFEEQSSVLAMPAIVKLATNKHILKLVRHYLGALPRLSAMGISIYQPEQEGLLPSGDWHIDKGPISSLKMFIYLNDVNADNGPHAFVAGSHNDAKVEDALNACFSDNPDLVEQFLEHQRWATEDVAMVFPGREVFHTGPAGFAILEDIRGLHRATPLNTGQRIMLTLEWSLDPSPLGGQREKMRFEDIPGDIRPTSEGAEKMFRYIFSEYLRP
jgi:hypothetical protein